MVATRDPRVLAFFTVATTAGAYAFAKTSQSLTNPWSEQAKDQLEKKLRKDIEGKRYASHSQNALAILFESHQTEEQLENDENAKYKKHEIKLPGVVWHPKAEERDTANN